MPAVKFHCSTGNKTDHERIKNLTFLAGGALVREKVMRDGPDGWEAILEIMSEGGTLYRQVKELGLATKITLIN